MVWCMNNALRRLACVFTAVDQGSLRQAARVLRVRESSVSRNIVAIEQHLDMQLFHRHVHGVQLTQSGEAWVATARRHYEGLKDALAAERTPKPDARTLRIGLSTLGGRKFLTGLMRRFGELYPDVAVNIEDIRQEPAMAALRRRQIDIVFTSGIVSDAAWASETFGSERLFVLLPANHPLGQKRFVTWADLAHERLLVLPPQDSPVRGLLATVTVDKAPSVHPCRGSDATLVLKVQLGQGVTLAEESACSVAPDFTIWRSLEGPASVTQFKAVWLDSNPKRALLRFVATARQRVDAKARHA